MERFKSRSGTVRLASTSGKVVFVGEEFTKVPNELVAEAYAKQLVPESLLVEGAASASAFSDIGRREQVGAVIKTIFEMIDEGVEKTPDGQDLAYRGKPRVDAVSELAGFKVTGKEIDEALD